MLFCHQCPLESHKEGRIFFLALPLHNADVNGRPLGDPIILFSTPRKKGQDCPKRSRQSGDRITEADVWSDRWSTKLACLIGETIDESKARLALAYARVSGA
jgi:hypothetical protein